MSRSPARAGSQWPADNDGASGRPPTPSHVRLNPSAQASAQEALARALARLQEAPGDAAAWDDAERQAELTDQPEALADAFLALLTTLEGDAREALASRAHRFHERWFGDDVARMRRLLSRVLELCPGATWAFDALVTILTVDGDWQALLDAYDRVLAAVLPEARRRELLVDAAHVAKDFADQPERAIAAVRELSRLSPEGEVLGASVARVLQERKQWRALISLWQAQLEGGHTGGEIGLRLQIAEIHLAHLREPECALEQAVCVLSARPGHLEACQMLERVLAFPDTSSALRMTSLAHLRLHHQAAHRMDALCAALELALPFVEAHEALALYRELGERMAAEGRWVEAMESYAALLVRAPGDVEARAQLRTLASRTGEHERHAAALIAAAHASGEPALKAELLLAAMAEHRVQLGRHEEAVQLATRVLELEHVDARSVRAAASTIAELCVDPGQERARIGALEHAARVADDPLELRRLWREIARAWQRLGEPARALSAWDARLAHDHGDLEALTEAVTLCETLGFHDALVVRLRERARRAPFAGQRRVDLLRVAALEASELHDPARAIDTLFTARKEFGDDPELLEALDGCLSRAGRFVELAEALAHAGESERKVTI